VSREQLQMTESFARRSLQAHRLVYPSEEIVRFLSRAPDNGIAGGDGLDVGFGSGRHLQTLMDFGYRASGVELCKEAIDEARHRFAGEARFGELHHGDFRSCRLRPESFAVIIFWGTIFLRPRADVVVDLRTAGELLTPEGRLCVNFRTTRNWFHGLGRELEPGFFQLDHRAGPYADALYAFFDEPDVRSMVREAGLELEDLELLEHFKKQISERHSWLIAHVRRAPTGSRS